MKRKILIVDGSNLLFQMFFGMPARIYNEQGIGIWEVLGFVGVLLKIIRRVEPTHVAVLFDGESENERTALDSDYKENICTPEYLKEKLGIEPSQYVEFKSLTGDKADNIVGAPKIGPKTASALLQEFGILDNKITTTEVLCGIGLK